MKKQTVMSPLRQQDLEMILAWRNHPNVRKNMYTSHEISMDEHTKWFETLKQSKNKEYFIFSLEKNPVGVIGFTNIDMKSKQCVWAFYANPEAPRGSGSLMEFYALEYIFNTKNLRKLNCEVLGFNTVVVKLHCKFGFQIEGTLRDAHYDGKDYHNIVQLGIFDNEWADMRDSMAKKMRIDL